MIEIDNLSIYYGQEEALKNIDLKIEKGSTCAIIGPSGCGKTTLLYSLAGLIEPDRGQVSILGEKLEGIRQETGVILQDYGLLPWKTVWENVALGLQIRDTAQELITKRVSDILTVLRIEEFKDKYPAELSGGQRQRVAIGRTLATQPDLLLMDEPSSSLDAITKEHIQNLVLRIYKENPMTIVLVTHNIEEAVFLGQKIVIMEKSKIRHILDNPYFGDDKLREKMDFYKKCLEIRKWMDKDGIS